MQRDRNATAERLLHDVGFALRHGYPPRELIPMLDKLIAHAQQGSDAAIFGMRELARLLVAVKPWRAARLASEVLRYGDDVEAWSTLGIALSMLGHFRAAARAHRRALALNPKCAVTLHNLGHLLDVGLGRPDRGLHYLHQALRAQPEDLEIAASCAHALLGLGRRNEARELLRARLPGGVVEADQLLDSWA